MPRGIPYATAACRTPARPVCRPVHPENPIRQRKRRVLGAANAVVATSVADPSQHIASGMARSGRNPRLGAEYGPPLPTWPVTMKSGHSRIAMVQATQIRPGNHAALLRRVDRPRNRRIAIQRHVRSGFVVVREVFGQNVTQVLLAEHDHVVQALPTYRADQLFDVRILPRRPWCNEHFLDPHVLDSIAEVLTVDAIAIWQHKTRSLFEWKMPRRSAGQPTGR